jgi:hypothetical protein
MMYHYEDLKPKLFTDDGRRMFLKMRDAAFRLIALAGAARLQEIMIAGELSGDTWDMLACTDRMVELGDLIEVTDKNVAGQHRIFRRPYSQ